MAEENIKETEVKSGAEVKVAKRTAKPVETSDTHQAKQSGVRVSGPKG